MKKFGFAASCLLIFLLSTAFAQRDTVVVWIDDNEPNQCNIDVLQPGFNATSETAEVEFVRQPEQWDVTRTAILGGAGPDVVITPGPSFVFELAKAGLLQALDRETFGENFVDWALSLGEVDGTLYSLPTELETVVLYYNKTLFEERGWSPPTTIDELMSLSEEIAAQGIIPFAHSNAEWRPTNEWFVSAFFNHMAGPDAVYASLTGEKAWTDPAFVEAVEALDRVQQEGWFSGSLEDYYTALDDDRLSAFGSGEAAMNIEGSWRIENLDQFFGEDAGNENAWDWAPFPSASGEPTYSIGIGSTYSINAASDVPEAASEFLQYLFSPEVQAQLAVQCGRAPAPIRLDAELMSDLDPREARLFEAIGTASDAGNYGYLTWTFWPPKSDVYIYEEIERLWDGQITAEAYLAGLQAVFSEELAAGDVPPLPSR